MAMYIMIIYQSRGITSHPNRRHRTLQIKEREIMENLILAIFIYAAAVAIAFSPNSPVEKIEYFPEIEPTDEPDKKSHLVNLPVRGYESSFVNSQNPTAIAPKTFLHGLSIRELKKLASIRKIPRYGSKTKKELILALMP